MKQAWLVSKYCILLALSPALLVVIYLAVALLGALIPVSIQSEHKNPDEDVPSVLLLTSMLHADIAIPVTDDVRRRLAFLRAEGFPLDNPHLKYLIIGWGSKEFYTSTKDYADIGFKTTWTAITGDQPVMHVQVAGELKGEPDIIELGLNRRHFDKLLTFIDRSFYRSEGSVQLLPGEGFGLGDRFFKGVGWFNIFNPCNLWVSMGLREAGFTTGLWTPTTYSLKLAHWLHN